MPAPKNFPEPPKGFTYDKGVELDDAIQTMLPKEVGLSGMPKNELKTKNYAWHSPGELSKYIKGITGQKTIKDAEFVVINWQENYTQAPGYSEGTTTVVEPPKYAVESNTLTPDRLRELQESADKETKRRVGIEQSAADVRAAIARKQALHREQVANEKKVEAKLKGQTVFYKVDPAFIEKTQEVKNLEEQAQANPEKFVEDTIKEFESKAEEAIGIPNQTPEQQKLAAKQAGLITYDTFTGNSPIISAAVINKIVSEPKILNAIAPDPFTQRILTDASEDLTNQKITQRDLANRFANLSKIDGLTAYKNAGVQVSYAARPGFKEFNINEQIITPHLESLSRQGDFLDSLKGLGEDEIKAQVLSKTGVFLDGQIAKLPAGSSLSIYQSKIVQASLSYLGLGTEIEWAGTTTLGKIAIGAGYGPTLGWAGQITGIDFGVRVAGGALGKTAAATGTKIAITGGTMASEAFLGGAGTAATTVVTSKGLGALLGGLIGNIPGFIAGLAVGKLLEKPISKLLIWFKKHQDLLGALGIGGIVTIFGGPIVGVGIGALSFIVLGGSVGATLGGFVLFTRNLALSLALQITAFAIIVFLVFSAIVAFVLFIINSGAYVVPPSPLTSSLGRGLAVECTSKQSPVQIPGPTPSSPIANRALEIVSHLYQGFWCYWNKSPDYPDLFDTQAYLNNPNPSEASGPNLFWCTYLVIKAYQETGHNIPADLGVTAMKNHWPSNKIISAKDATSQNIVPGSAVFFGVPANGPGLQHVGIVYSVDPGGIVVVESNNAVKSESINFNSGSGVGSLPGMYVDSFGLP